MYALLVWVSHSHCGTGPVCASDLTIELSEPARTFPSEEACLTALKAAPPSPGFDGNRCVQVGDPPPPPEPKDWHVLVQTYGGTVSLLKDLTKAEADATVKRLTPDPCGGYYPCSYQTTADMVKSATAFK